MDRRSRCPRFWTARARARARGLVSVTLVLFVAGGAFAVATQAAEDGSSRVSPSVAEGGRKANAFASARRSMPARRSGDQAARLVVKYRAEGPHALEECAERISRARRRFAPHTADGDEALDDLETRFGPLRHRAVFRRAGDGDLAEGARALETRLRRARERRGRRLGKAAPRFESPLPDLAHIYRVRIPEEADPEALLAGLRAAGPVEWAQLDHEIALSQLSPPGFDDPFLATSGAWGQPYADLWGLDRVDAPGVWSLGLGEGQVVAVVDTGVDTRHPDLAANVWVNPGEDLDGDGVAEPSDRNGIDDDGNGFVDDLEGFDFGESFDANEDGDFDDPGDRSDADPFDERGHGTHVAGTIAAVANNGEGIVGVAPGVRLMAVKGFPAEGPGRDSVLWRAVLYAAENGADVINNSWSCGDPCPSNPLATDVLAHVEALGAVVVTSAGNAASDVALRSPENTDAVLTVGAIGFDDRLPPFSNRGWGLDLVAPGGGPSSTPGVLVPRRNILSLLSSALLESESPFIVGESYRRLAGTSMSAPHVAGAVALARQRHPELPPAAIRDWLRVGARDLGASGHDWLYGAGALHLPTLFAQAPPDVALALDLPRSGGRVDPSAGPIRFDVAADGSDVVGLDLALAEGLIGRDFVPIAEVPGAVRVTSGSSGDEALAFEWDAREAPAGPRTLRVRVALREGREVVRFRVFGLERVEPEGYTRGDRDVGGPATDGRRLAWPMEREAGDRGIAVGRLRTASPAAAHRRPGAASRTVARRRSELEPTVQAVDGQPRDVDLSGSLLAWRSLEEGRFSIGWCRLDRAASARGSGPSAQRRARPRREDRCRPQRIERSDESPTRPWVAGGWIVWQVGGSGGPIEGCRPKRGRNRCDPSPLVSFADADPRWRLRSFDGGTLLLDANGRLARCAVRRDGVPCVPEEILVTPGTARPDAPVHSGEHIAFGVVGIEFQPPVGCVFGDALPECVPTLQVVTRLHACRVAKREEGGAPVCEAHPIAPAAPIEALSGPRVSGRRVVWSVRSALDPAAVSFCEFDASTGRCPPQRVTAGVSGQFQPDVSGRTLVWRGARDAGDSIWSLSLPDLRVPDRPFIRPSGAFRVPLRARAGDAGDLAIEARVLEADPSLALAPTLKVLDFGRAGGRIWLVGRTASDGAGLARVEVVARDHWGLESRRTLDLRFEARAVEE